MGDNTSKTGGAYASTQTQRGLTANNPYGIAKPALDMGLSQLQQLFKGGKLAPNVGINSLQREGINGIANTARQGAGALNPAITAMGRFATGGGDVSGANQDELFGNIRGIARGDFIGGDDPAFEDMLSRATGRAADEAMFRAGARGRGAGSYSDDVIARAVGDTQANARWQNLESQRNRMMEANNLGLNIANSGTAIDAANRDRQMAGASMLPGLTQARAGLYDMLAGAGDRAQDLKTAFAMGPANNLASLFQMLGVAQPYATQRTSGTNTTAGTMSGTSKEPDNWFGKILGAGGGLASLFG